MMEEKKPKSWLKSISAFANGIGGSLFFGIDNEGVIRGIDDGQRVAFPRLRNKLLGNLLFI